MLQNPYVEFLRTWFLVILLGVVVAVFATNQALDGRAPLYRATSTLQVGRLLDSRTPNQNDVAIIERLIPAYSEIARRDVVLDEASANLELDLTAEALRGLMHVQPVPQTQLIDIHFVTADPELSAALANEVARQVVLQSPPATDAEASPAFIQSQLSDLQAKITGAQEEMADIDATIGNLTSAADVFDAQERRTLLAAQIDTWQQTFAGLLSSAEPTHSNIVRIASDAPVPSTPVPSQTIFYYGLAAVTGAGLATLLALGLNTVGRSLKTMREVKDLGVSQPVFSVPRYHVPSDGTPVSLKDLDSPATSAYRVLRNTLMVRQKAHEKNLIAVTSTRPGEGKTTTVANLGIALANSGLKVLLVDTNVRNPELDQVLGVETTLGFSDLLLGDTSIDKVWHPTNHHNLAIIGAGTIPPHHTDLLSSTILSHLVSDLSRTADVVVFDTAAFVQEQESQLLTQHVNGVLLVAEAGRIKGSDLQSTLDSLQRVNAPVVAVVLNKTRERRSLSSRLPWSRENRLKARANARRAQRARAAMLEGSAIEAGQFNAASD